MKKLIPKKLRINRETIRSLAAHELTQAVGGDTATLATGRTVCPTAALDAQAIVVEPKP
jgi:hypothetical protein